MILCLLAGAVLLCVVLAVPLAVGLVGRVVRKHKAVVDGRCELR